MARAVQRAKVPAVPLWVMGWSVVLVSTVSSTMAAPQVEFGSLSTANPNVRREMRQTTEVTLEGFGTPWPRITGLGIRTGIRFRNRGATLERLVTSLQALGKGLPWDRHTGNDQIRVYLDRDKSSPPDMIWYFLRDGKAYCVPELYGWSTGRYLPQKQMFLLSPVSRKRFKALIHSISEDARRHRSPFTLIDFGGD